MTKEFLVFSDHHAHNFSYGATRTKRSRGFYNSRLVSSVEVLGEIKKYAEDHDIDTILFGGDL